MFIDQVTVQDPEALFEIIQQAKPLGVQARLQIALQEPVFKFDMPQIAASHFMECFV